MFLARLHKNRPFVSWLTHEQPDSLPPTIGALLWHFIKLRPFGFYLLLAATALTTCMLLAIPYVIKLIIDQITTAPVELTDRLAYVMPHFLLLVGMMVTRFFLQYTVWSTSYQWRAPMWGRVHYTILSYVERHQHSFFENDFSGRIIQKATSLFSSTIALFDTVLWNLIPSLFYFIVTLVMLSTVNIWLGIFGLLWFAIVFGGASFVGRGITSSAKKVNEERSRAVGHFADVITNIRNVIHYGHEQQEILTQAQKVEPIINADRYWYLHLLNVRVYNQMMIAFGILGLIGTSIVLWAKSLVTAGDIALVGTLTLLIMQRALELAENLPTIMDTIGTAQDSLDTLVKPRVILDVPNAPDLHVTHGEIKLDNATFRYPTGGDIFKDFNLTIKPGERIGLVGTSGAGKTTLVHLLLRLYDVQHGAITIDGQDLKKVNQQSLRRNIAFIPQDIVLFHRSVGDNIRYGRLDARDDEVVAAAEAAQAHGFISTFPQGYDTLVGERGVRLSGGQRQRVAIARALLKNAPILILDEATSALDSEAEAEIQAAIKLAMTGKTVIAIAHRLSTISSLDRLIVLEDGKISEEGSHAELLSKNGLYARLWARQSGGFLGLE